MREARAPQLPQALLARCRSGEPGPVGSCGRDSRPTGSPRRRPTAARPPVPSGRSAGWRRPGRATLAGDSAVCCAPASSACARSTSTGPPSAARSCGPGLPATVRPWPSSAPGPRWPAVTRDSCCGGPNGGVPRPSPRPLGSARHDARTAADLAALRAQRRRLDEARSEGAPTDALEARATRLEQPVRRRLLQERGSGEAAAALDVGVAPRGAHRGRHGPRRADRARRRPARARGGSRPRTPPGGRRCSGCCRCRGLLVVHPAPGRARAPGPARGGRRPARARAARGRAGRRGGVARRGVRHLRRCRACRGACCPSLAHRPVTSTPSARLWLRARSAPARRTTVG